VIHHRGPPDDIGEGLAAALGTVAALPEGTLGQLQGAVSGSPAKIFRGPLIGNNGFKPPVPNFNFRQFKINHVCLPPKNPNIILYICIY
jgi:hypothetical protein